MKDTLFKVFVAGGTLNVVVSSGTLTARTENLNQLVTVNNNTSTSVLGANAARKAAYVLNPSATARLHLRLASAAAAATNIWIEPNGVYAIVPDSNGGIYQGEVRAFQASGGNVDVGVIEFN